MRPLTEDLSMHIALVTGGARGIGQATVRALAAKGARVVIHYHTQADSAHALANELQAAGHPSLALQADLSEPAAATDLVKAVIQHFGSCDILVNNAAAFTTGPTVSMSDAQWEHTLNVNLSAAFRCIRAVLPGMQAQRWGRIINVTSQAAWNGSANHAHYAAAKAGLAGLTYSVAKEVASQGITVNLVAPGRILTDMIANDLATREAEWLQQIPMHRFGEPAEVATAIAFLASEAARYITGSTLHVNGGQLMS
jgi:NAD(P)-dependent dehydrogenase (short-subunit alcohol dehydrogenase family)